MLHVHPTADHVFLVTRMIPALGATVADHLVVRRRDAMFPLVLRRYFKAAMVALIPDNAVLFLGATHEAIAHCDYSMELTLAVREAIPALGAQGGDELCVRPTDHTMPFVLRRSFPLEMLAAVPASAVSLLGAAESSDDLALKRRRATGRARALALVRRAG